MSGQLVTALAFAATTNVVVQTAGALHTDLDTGSPSLQARGFGFSGGLSLACRWSMSLLCPSLPYTDVLSSLSFYKDTSPSRGSPHLCSHRALPTFVKALCPSSVLSGGLPSSGMEAGHTSQPLQCSPHTAFTNICRFLF